MPVVRIDRILPGEQTWSDGGIRFDFLGHLRSGVHTTPTLPGLVVRLPETPIHIGAPPDNLAGLEQWAFRMGLGEAVGPHLSACFSAWWGVDLVPVTFLVPRPRALAGRSGDHGHIDCVSVGVDRGGNIIPLLNVEPTSRDQLVRLSGSRPVPPLLVVGAGALGSRMATHLARCGISRMDIVDPDIFLEHNPPGTL